MLEVFDLKSRKQIYYVKNETEDPQALLPVAFAHSGEAILCGSSIGKPRLWNCLDGDHLHHLHDGDNKG